MNLDWSAVEGAPGVDALGADAPSPVTGVADPAFPQRFRLHDLGPLRQALAPTLAERAPGALRRPGPCPEGGELVDVWHIAGRELHGVARLHAAGGSGEHLVRLGFGRFGEPRPAGGVAVPEWNATAWVLPGDPDLPALRTLASTERMETLVTPLLTGRAGPPGQPGPLGGRNDRLVIDPHVDVLGYLPGRRAALRYRTSSGDLLVKIDPSLDHGALARRHAAVADWAARRPALRVSRPLGVLSAIGARVETVVDGERPEQHFATIDLGALVSGVAAAAAALHELPLDGLGAQTPARICDRARRKVLTRLAIVAPEHHGRASALLERLTARAPLPPRLAATLHNDLHPANVLVDTAGRVTLIDLDSIALGDPAWDLALFATRLWLVSLVRGERWDDVIQATALLRDEYEREAATAISESTWRWYLAATLLARQVKVCVRHGGPAATSLIARLLDEAETLLDAEPATVLSAAGAGRRPGRA